MGAGTRTILPRVSFTVAGRGQPAMRIHEQSSEILGAI